MSQVADNPPRQVQRDIRDHNAADNCPRCGRPKVPKKADDCCFDPKCYWSEAVQPGVIPTTVDYIEAHRQINSICRHGYSWPNCNFCHAIEPEIKKINERLDRIEAKLGGSK